MTRRKIWLIIGGVAVLLLVFAAFFAKDYVAQEIRQRVEAQLRASDQFTYDSMRLDVYPDGYLTLQGVQILQPLTGGLAAFKGQSAVVKIPEIHVTGIRWLPLIFRKKLNIERLEILQPSVLFSTFADSLQAPHTVEKHTEKKGLRRLYIASIIIQDGSFRSLKAPGDTVSTASMDTFNFVLNELYVSLRDTKAPYSFVQANFSMSNFKIENLDGMHGLTLGRLQVSKADSTVKLSDMRLVPLYGKREFSRHLTWKKPRMDFRFPEISLCGIQFDRLLEGGIVARTLRFDDANLDLFLDLNVPHNIHQYRPMLQEMLMKLPMPLALDSLKMRGSNLHFELLLPGKPQPGIVDVQPLETTCTNITNDTARIRKHRLMEIAVKGKFQKLAWAVNRFQVDMSSQAQAFSFQGDIEPMPFATFNHFLSPSMNVWFEGGNIKKMHYEVNADKNTSKGTMNLQYEGVDIALYNAEKKRKRKLLSELAERIAIKTDNVAGDKKFESCDIAAERDRSRSIINYWWNSVQSGLIDCLLTDFILKRMEKTGGQPPLKNKKKAERLKRKADKKNDKKDKRPL